MPRTTSALRSLGPEEPNLGRVDLEPLDRLASDPDPPRRTRPANRTPMRQSGRSPGRVRAASTDGSPARTGGKGLERSWWRAPSGKTAIAGEIERIDRWESVGNHPNAERILSRQGAGNIFDISRLGARLAGASSQCLTMIVFSPQSKPVTQKSRALATKSPARRSRILNSFFTAEIAEIAETTKAKKREKRSDGMERPQGDRGGTSGPIRVSW